MWSAQCRSLHLPALIALKTALFACFRFLIFHPFFQGGQLTPSAPMCGCPWGSEAKGGRSGGVGGANCECGR